MEEVRQPYTRSDLNFLTELPPDFSLLPLNIPADTPPILHLHYQSLPQSLDTISEAAYIARNCASTAARFMHTGSIMAKIIHYTSSPPAVPSSQPRTVQPCRRGEADEDRLTRQYVMTDEVQLDGQMSSVDRQTLILPEELTPSSPTNCQSFHRGSTLKHCEDSPQIVAYVVFRAPFKGASTPDEQESLFRAEISADTRNNDSETAQFIVKLKLEDQSLNEKIFGKGYEERYWELQSLVVDKSFQRRGLGSMLVRWGIEVVKSKMKKDSEERRRHIGNQKGDASMPLRVAKARPWEDAQGEEVGGGVTSLSLDLKDGIPWPCLPKMSQKPTSKLSRKQQCIQEAKTPGFEPGRKAEKAASNTENGAQTIEHMDTKGLAGAKGIWLIAEEEGYRTYEKAGFTLLAERQLDGGGRSKMYKHGWFAKEFGVAGEDDVYHQSM